MTTSNAPPGFSEENAHNLDYYHTVIQKTIIAYQHPITGLIPAQPGSHTWVRDCVYALHSIWALALAYQKANDKNLYQTVQYELKHRTIKGMRGLLYCMMSQADKVRDFIKSQSHLDALHAKYDTATGAPVVGDDDWGHLQMDATSLYVLTLAQMTSSGFVIVQSMDEVEFVQSLVIYIHLVYRTPDYGVSERGDKNNKGIRELSSCSIGMAKSALAAIRNLNLFGARGGYRSIIQVPPDMSRQCNIMLEAILPRGSISKEFESSVLSIISYPAFAVEKEDIIRECHSQILDNLKGQYGLKRFLMDGYMTALEDKSRLYYKPGELRSFEGIECQWPIYYCYLWLDALFSGSMSEAESYKATVDRLVVMNKDGLPLMPEFYFVPAHLVNAEKEKPGSQHRLCGGKVPFIWGQSMFILSNLLHHEFVSLGDIDPVNRRLTINQKPATIVQVLVFAENEKCLEAARSNDIPAVRWKNESLELMSPVVLRGAWQGIGNSTKLNFQSYAQTRTSILRTSVIYLYQNQYYLSFPEYADRSTFYSNTDIELYIQNTTSRLSYLTSQWWLHGRPTLAIMLTSQNCHDKSLLRFLVTLKSGSFLGVQVKLCNDVEHALSAACVQQLPLRPQTSDISTEYMASPARTAIPSIQALFGDAVIAQSNEFLSKLDSSLDLVSKWSVIKAYHDKEGSISKDLIHQIEKVYERACIEKSWYIARHCAAVLYKVQTSLCDDLTHILVQQKQISFGVGDEEITITAPIPPHQIYLLIIKSSTNCLLLFVVYQELVNYLAQIIQRAPKLFKGILRIRVGLIVSLIVNELCPNDKGRGWEILCSLKPIRLYRILFGLLNGGESVSKSGASEPLGVTDHADLDSSSTESEESPWQRRRCVDGALNRLPNNFHSHLYKLLTRSSGVEVESHFLSSMPTVNEMTGGEVKFVLLVESWFDKIPDPQLRQLYVEVIMVLAALEFLNLGSHQVIKLDSILHMAHKLFLQDEKGFVEGSESVISEEFYKLAPSGQFGTLSYITRAIVDAMGC